MALVLYRTNMSSHCQLARSLERILEEAHLSGELKLSNRKLKDFPKSATKYNLSDTVIADLSRNRFCELPDEITSFAFLETLLLYHNTIKIIPQSVKGLTSLTYLDLRSNHLTSLPRELCFLPIQVLLVANNRLLSLPDELGRMEKLTDLDASCNQIANLPTRIGDLQNLRSLSLRSNQLVYVPRELTYLSLVSLDISNNRISSLPIEIRQMTSLVSLKLENNPLTSPPANLCIRGLVHILKFLENQALKDDRLKPGGNFDGYSTLRRTSRNSSTIVDTSKNRRQNVDSGYCTSDGLDKRWCQDIYNVAKNGTSSPKHSPPQELTPTDIERSITIKSENQTTTNNLEEKNMEIMEQIDKKINSYFDGSNSNSGNTSPEGEVILERQKSTEKNKDLGNIQTYREYKEALKQQRNQEVSNVYRMKSPKPVYDNVTSIPTQSTDVLMDSVVKINSINSEKHRKNDQNNQNTNRIVPLISKNGTLIDDSVTVLKKPVQKVIPSRNIKGNKTEERNVDFEKDYTDYVKPSSPIKCNGSLSNNHTFIPNKSPPTTKGSKLRLSRNVSWNQDMSPEKLSFTMRREFDKQKEETELIAQLRNIIETRLKMSLPEDIASALTDGVILCHLANSVRPRSVASIHVPSPGVPKLTMARCRRNVDNFLEACRKIGVDEEFLCSCADVVSNEESSDESLPNPTAVYRTISALLGIIHNQSHQQGDSITPATNSNKNGQQENSYATLESNDNENTAQIYINPKQDNNVEYEFLHNSFVEQLTNVYSSDDEAITLILNSKKGNNEENGTEDVAGRLEYFNRISNMAAGKDSFENGEILKVNDLNASKQNFEVKKTNNININNEKNIPQKIVTKRIEFFEEKKYGKDAGDQTIFSIYNPSADNGEKVTAKQDSFILTIFLSSIFILTFLLLIIFPLPN